jgi:phasin family protein
MRSRSRLIEPVRGPLGTKVQGTGGQQMMKQFATTVKESFEESVATFTAFSSVKSVKEAIDLQSGFARTAFEKAMAEANKMTDASIRLTEQALAPLTARVIAAVDTIGKQA